MSQRTAARAEDDPQTASMAAYFDFVEEESELYRVFFRQAAQSDAAIRDLSREIWQRFVSHIEASACVTELGAHALAGMTNELALWWLEDRRLTKAEIVERALRLERATCEVEGNHGSQEPPGAAGR